MQQTFTSLREFDFANSQIYLWIYKRSTTAHKFSAHYVQTDDALNALLLGVIQSELRRISEFAEYSYLAVTSRTIVRTLDE